MKNIIVLKDKPYGFYAHQVDHYASRWMQMGYYVSYHYGSNQVPDADLIVPCIDKTRVDKQYIEIFTHTPSKVLNAGITDISKRSFSSLQLSQDDNYQGKVIVKPNNNAMGLPEFHGDNTLINKLMSRTPADISADELRSSNDKLSFGKYPIYNSPQDVPSQFWDSRGLIIERFIDKPLDAKLYTVYFYSFFGNKGICGRLNSTDPIVRWNSSLISSEYINPPSIVLDWKKNHKIDFGRFDFLKRDDEYVLIDINKTEGGGGSKDIPKYVDEFWYLSRGIKDYLP